MSTEKKSDTVSVQPTFTSLPAETDNLYATRDANNTKLDVADLFTHFTASIIKEDKLFTR
ncbi:MAG: hypothetical protein ABJC98_09820 [Bacteroidota bacterium]